MAPESASNTVCSSSLLPRQRLPRGVRELGRGDSSAIRAASAEVGRLGAGSVGRASLRANGPPARISSSNPACLLPRSRRVGFRPRAGHCAAAHRHLRSRRVPRRPCSAHQGSGRCRVPDVGARDGIGRPTRSRPCAGVTPRTGSRGADFGREEVRCGDGVGECAQEGAPGRRAPPGSALTDPRRESPKSVGVPAIAPSTRTRRELQCRRTSDIPRRQRDSRPVPS